MNAYGFTGDSSTGKIIMRGAASGLRDVLLELGGKNVGIIFPDADLEEAAKTCAMASFTNTGQVCLSIEKLYVAREIFEPFMTLFVNHARKITLGGPSDDRADIGPLISKKHRERVQSFVDNACEEGAEIICGGKAPSFGDERDNGYFFEPTILTGLSEDAHVMTNEIFGPVCHVGPFDSEAEVLGYANQPPYGLISMIWTKDVSRAHRFGRSIRAGINWVNCWQVRYLRTPLQGFDQSGVGTQGGRQSLEFYTNVSTVTMML
ncbi:MAG: hypothetical protein COA91_11130 [Robiginitomaculum sp.]|nr:MAG: hypothetical protein COA91_11130 [Robiginitomaculum sp.]